MYHLVHVSLELCWLQAVAVTMQYALYIADEVGKMIRKIQI